MAYITIGGTDFSDYCNSLDVVYTHQYNSQINAAGNTVVDYINQKRTINVGIIPVEDNIMSRIQNAISSFQVSITYRDPKSNILETADCIIPTSNVSYYTIQSNKVLYNAITLSFIEL